MNDDERKALRYLWIIVVAVYVVVIAITIAGYRAATTPIVPFG